MQVFEVALPFIQNIHLYVHEVPKVHLLVHRVEDCVYNRKMVVCLLVFHSPYGCHLLVLFRILRYLLPETNLFLDFYSRFFEVSQIFDDVRVGDLVVNFVAIVESICL